MLDLAYLKTFYPENLRHHELHIVREYLQYKILQIIYNSSFKHKLCFMGGTAIRIIHGTRRFSEDLDFDNLGLDGKAFEALAQHIKDTLAKEGFKIETSTKLRNAFHCDIKFLSLLFELRISGHAHQKLNIQLDTEPQRFSYEPQLTLINKFDIFQNILAIPAPILLSQKLYAILNRKRTMGRDFYDAIFLFSKTTPDLAYLKFKTGIDSWSDLRQKLSAHCDALKLDILAEDIAPFLFEPKDAQRITFFKEFIDEQIGDLA